MLKIKSKINSCTLVILAIATTQWECQSFAEDVKQPQAQVIIQFDPQEVVRFFEGQIDLLNELKPNVIGYCATGRPCKDYLQLQILEMITQDVLRNLKESGFLADNSREALKRWVFVFQGNRVFFSSIVSDHNEKTIQQINDNVAQFSTKYKIEGIKASNNLLNFLSGILNKLNNPPSTVSMAEDFDNQLTEMKKVLRMGISSVAQGDLPDGFLASMVVYYYIESIYEKILDAAANQRGDQAVQNYYGEIFMANETIRCFSQNFEAFGEGRLQEIKSKLKTEKPADVLRQIMKKEGN